jgi:hypothetical protein
MNTTKPNEILQRHGDQDTNIEQLFFVNRCFMQNNDKNKQWQTTFQALEVVEQLNHLSFEGKFLF